MRRTIAIGLWATLLASLGPAWAQEAPPKAPEATKPPGKRLHVQFQETRLRGESTTATRTTRLALHTDAEGASVSVGSQIPISVAGKEATTTLIKSVGIEGRAKVETLADGRYRLEAHFEESSVLEATGGAAAAASGDNPILLVVRGESTLVLREGETVPFASAVDPVTGEAVRVDVLVTAAPMPKAAPVAGRGEGRLRARLVLVRRQGDTKVARRPYSVVLQAPGEGAAAQVADLFSGSMLPLLVKVQGEPTAMFKDVGAGLRLKAQRVPDGRYRLDLSFSDGVLAAGKGSPIIRAFQSETQLFVQEGEALTVASSADPQTGEVVEAEVTVERVP